MTAPATAAQKIGFVDYLKSKLTPQLLEDLAKRLVTYAEKNLPGASSVEKKAYCVEQALIVLEAFDDRVPVLGKWMDLPLVDWLEKWATEQLIEWAWGAAIALAEPNTAA
ncbi:hypothetical protein [uncultured Deinococcus sp.]|uniref:hypothetical protein n=1 Tax=uncultured Deinococcus sp. TaxID=158789 RepID=UPI00258A5CEB|nr:hypothetical protein [uncultured Deinococcus sp.]